jgi:hypothetical protein
MTDRELRAQEAKRLLREISPYIDELRAQALEEAVRVPRWGRWGDGKRRALMERAAVCDAIKSRLLTVIATGKPS